MRKLAVMIAGVMLVVYPITALAAPADVSSTSNFSVTIVAETLGLKVTGETQKEVVSRTNASEGKFTKVWYQRERFPITITNTGNTPGNLSFHPGSPTGVIWGTAEGNLTKACVKVPNEPSSVGTCIVESEEGQLNWLDERFDQNGDPGIFSPKEVLNIDVELEAKDKFPVGEVTVPVTFVLKAN